VKKRVALLALAVATSLGPVYAGPAYAGPGCAQGIQALAQRLPAVTDAHLRTVLDNDLRHARKEAAEGDQGECVDILDHADKVLNPAQ